MAQLSGSTITSLFIDSNQTIYAGTTEGLYIGNGDSFSRVESETLSITSICSDKKGSIYVGAGSDGVYLVTKTNQANKYSLKSLNLDTSSLNMTSMFVNSEGTVYLGSTTGLYKVNDKVSNNSPETELVPGTEEKNIQGLAGDDNGRIYFGEMGEGAKLSLFYMDTDGILNIINNDLGVTSYQNRILSDNSGGIVFYQNAAFSFYSFDAP